LSFGFLRLADFFFVAFFLPFLAAFWLGMRGVYHRRMDRAIVLDQKILWRRPYGLLALI
jgi:hypothetical protein